MPEEAQQCIFCLIGEGKIQSANIWNDADVVAFLEIKPASNGHIVVISKVHAPLISMLPKEVSAKMFSIALSIGSGIVKKLGATGVTYLINEGKGAGQKIAHAAINIIPRYDNDGVTISWPEKKLSQDELTKYISGIFEKLQSPEDAKKESHPVQAAQPPKEEKNESPKKEEKTVVIKERVPRYW
ncbi:HIT domain protein [Candidatus Tiddalikarchaeum anstoanum]|nr:HIT domain protein [Candidatus Tiddalikarchaeum anstoanum]